MRLRRVPSGIRPSLPQYSAGNPANRLHSTGTKQHPYRSCQHHQYQRRHTFHPVSSLPSRMPLCQFSPAYQRWQNNDDRCASSHNSNQPFENSHILSVLSSLTVQSVFRQDAGCNRRRSYNKSAPSKGIRLHIPPRKS